LKLVQFPLPKADDGDATVLTCFANYLAKELSLGCMNESV
jgi:hypothetical protein